MNGAVETDGKYPVVLKQTDGLTSVTGKTYADVTVVYSYEGGTNQSYTLAAADWVEAGSGKYWLTIGAAEWLLTGNYQVSINCANCIEYNFPVTVVTSGLSLGTIVDKPTIAELKSKQYLEISDTTYDTAISNLIDFVTYRALSWMDDDDATSLNAELHGAIALQVTYEFLRRKDPGLSSVTLPDGSIVKYEVREWLPRVRSILERNRSFGL